MKHALCYLIIDTLINYHSMHQSSNIATHQAQIEHRIFAWTKLNFVACMDGLVLILHVD
jgi:hypothetical protein